MDHRERTFGWFVFDEVGMAIILEEHDDDGKELVDLEIPAAFVVCQTCRGKGTHVNPSIDAHGISADEFFEDTDFAEDYHRGVYDQPCNECSGRRVVPRPSDQATPEQVEAFDEAERSVWETDAEMDAERRMGA